MEPEYLKSSPDANNFSASNHKSSAEDNIQNISNMVQSTNHDFYFGQENSYQKRNIDQFKDAID
jgi:ribosomal protein L31